MWVTLCPFTHAAPYHRRGAAGHGILDEKNDILPYYYTIHYHRLY